MLNKLINGDAMELITELDDHSIDLTILDPDYQDWDKLCEEGLICQAVILYWRNVKICIFNSLKLSRKQTKTTSQRLQTKTNAQNFTHLQLKLNK